MACTTHIAQIRALAWYLDGLAGRCLPDQKQTRAWQGQQASLSHYMGGMECMRAASGRSRLMRWPQGSSIIGFVYMTLTHDANCVYLPTYLGLLSVAVHCRPTVWFRKTEETG